MPRSIAFHRRIFLLLIGGGFVMVVVIPSIWIDHVNRRGRLAWESYQAAAEKRGEKLFLKDFVQPEIPDLENYAAVPLIQKLCKIRNIYSDESARIFEFPYSVTRCPWPTFSKGLQLYLAECQDLLLENGLLTEKSDNPARDILRALDRFEPGLRELRGASSRPRCRFPAMWDDGPSGAFIYLNPLCSAGSLFSLRTSAHLALGDSAEACREFRHAMRLYHALASIPFCHPCLVRTGLRGRLEATVWQGLAARAWADADLRAIETDLAALHVSDDVRFALSTQRGFVNQELSRLKTADASKTVIFESIARAGQQDDPSPLAAQAALACYPSGWVLDSMVLTNECFDLFLAPFINTSMPASSDFISSDSLLKEWFQSKGEANFIPYVFAIEMLMDLRWRQAPFLAAHTREQMVLLGCTIERFHRAKGSFPEKLDDLVPQFIAAVPKDIFGEPLRYRRTEDGGYDLWSIGPNRKDDGEIIDPKRYSWEKPGLIHMPEEQGQTD